MGIFGFGRKKKHQQADQAAETGQAQTPVAAEAAVDEAAPPAAVSDAPAATAVVSSPAAPESDPAPEARKKGLLARLAERLGKTREKISGSIDKIAIGRKIDDEVLDELEEVLVTADLGVKTTSELIGGLRGKVRRKELADAEALKGALRAGIEEIFGRTAAPPAMTAQPHVIMVVGVNGVGKTTTIGKLASLLSAQGKKVMLGAADTFRAAAAEQLEIWAQRVGCPIVRQKEGADPSAVAYDTVEAAVGRGVDVAIIDTAGRLHTKVNLMDELRKIHRVIGKKMDGAPHEVILVLDATTGQNALNQAKMFNEAVQLTGLILTKLDGTAKGGVAVAIAGELKLPICYVGVGEHLDDLRPFDAREFAEAIFG